MNRALHTIVLSRRRLDLQTKAYIARRVSEGKSEREAVRCLKRYLARSLFRLLEAMPQDLTLIEASPTPFFYGRDRGRSIAALCAASRHGRSLR